MPDAAIIAAVRNKYQALRPVLDEKVRRRWAACEALAIGWGGITAVAEATGLSRPTIRAPQMPQRTRMPSGNGSVRWAGGGDE